jgi:hypothetical protein|tara:strand:+ start:91 stop:483 length:393 start_codon:yes stop_codon:yes gene_type:complete
MELSESFIDGGIIAAYFGGTILSAGVAKYFFDNQLPKILERRQKLHDRVVGKIGLRMNPRYIDNAVLMNPDGTIIREKVFTKCEIKRYDEWSKDFKKRYNALIWNDRATRLKVFKRVVNRDFRKLEAMFS